MNIFTSAIIAILVILSLILTASVLYPNIGARPIIAILEAGALLSALIGGGVLYYRHRHRHSVPPTRFDPSARLAWRMPPLALLAAPRLSLGSRIGLTTLRSYLLIAMLMVVFRVYQLATGH
jgi:hypothetical protein